MVRTHLDSGSPLTLGLERHLLPVGLLRGVVHRGWLRLLLLVLLVEMMRLLLHLMLRRLRILPVQGRRPRR